MYIKKAALCIFISLIIALSGCVDSGVGGSELSEFNADDWVGKKLGLVTGMVYDKIMAEHIPGSEPLFYINMADGIEAMKNGRIDGFIANSVALIRQSIQTPDVRVLEPYVTNESYGAIVAKGNVQLREQLNEFITLINSNGVFEEMKERWILSSETPIMPDIPVGSGEVLRYVTGGTTDGFSYYSNGEISGFDVEFAKRFAAFIDRKLEISVTEFAGLITAIQTGKYDYAANSLTITEERAEMVDFTIPYYNGGAAIAVYSPSWQQSVFNKDDFEGKSFAIITGSIWDTLLDENIPTAVQVHFNSFPESIMALKLGKVDATFIVASLAEKYAVIYPDLIYLKPPFFETDIAFIFGKHNLALRDDFNSFMREIRENGMYDEIKGRWLGSGADTPDMPEFENKGTAGKLVFATTGEADLFTFVQNGKPAGFEVELAYRFAEHMNMELDIQLMEFSAIIPNVDSKSDFAGSNISVTEERAKTVAFSEPVYREGLLVAVRNEQYQSSSGFWEGVAASFERNLILENRWKLIVDGLGISMVITIAGFALATLLGFAVCGLRMSKNALLRMLGTCYITVLRGTPVVVLLMISFYVIFAKSTIDAVTVAIIAFGANGAAFIGEIIRSAILTVDKGQIEAARSMGFSKIGAFFTVIFPQAVRVAFPVYMSEFISLFKMTSVVGYIAIVDLTKAGDIIRSRTYDAFFPLIVVALGYLISASIMIWLFNLINRKTDKRSKRGAR
ncbi:MAG: ABC transporter permease subunit [Oscillospiraceae bacterium]|nr:ABC transporter permease subunit [Oscillospiraceae bacterium]